MRKKGLFTPDYAVSPEETVLEMLMHKKMDIHQPFPGIPMAALLDGSHRIDEKTAQSLEDLLGVTASFWLNLERQYQENLVESTKKDQSEEEN